MKFRDVVERICDERNPLKFLASRILARTKLSELLSMKIHRDGYTLHFFNTALSMNLWLYADERSEDVELIKILAPIGGTYVDIGANIGDLALAGATAVGNEGSVYAFEAHPRIFSMMCRNFALSGYNNIYPVNAACGEHFGWAQFSDKRSDDMNKIGSGGICVPVIPAQHLILKEKVDLIKIDVEGFELYVLKGLKDIISKTSSFIIEVGDEHFSKFGYKFLEIYNILNNSGFTILQKKFRNIDGEWSIVSDGNQPFPIVQNIIATRNHELIARLVN